MVKDYPVFGIFFIFAGLAAVGSYFAIFVFSMNGSFMERLITSPLSVNKILETKYYFLCIVSFIMLLLMFPLMLLGISFFQLISSFLYAIGFLYFGFFYTSLYSYKTLDIKKTSFYNFQGINVANYLFPILLLVGATGLVVLIHWLLREIVTWTVMFATGLIFVATHKIWLKYISKKFEKTRYKRLECFRES
jgi:hypothetical protein